jgi:hypothetical protein
MPETPFPFGGASATGWQVLTAAFRLCPVSLLLAAFALPVALIHGVRWKRMVGRSQITVLPRGAWDSTWFWPAYVWGVETVRAATVAFIGDWAGPLGLISLAVAAWQEALGCWLALVAILPMCMAAEAVAAYWHAPTRAARWSVPGPVLAPLLGGFLVWVLQFVVYTAAQLPRAHLP